MDSINERPIPVGLRYIPYDQWLLTHIHPGWKISQIKLFVLSKCLGTNYTVPLDLASSKRQSSPITFAPLNPTHGRARSTTLSGDAKPSKKKALADDGYEEDDEYNSDTEDDDATTNKPSTYRPGSSVHPMSTTVAADPSPPPAAYTLIRFSTGQILEDGFQLSSYNIAPYELLELHGEHTISMTKPVFPPRRNSLQAQTDQQSSSPPTQMPSSSSSPSTRLIKRIVCLDRTDINAYVAPYWEGWVKALRVVNRDDLDLAMRSQVARHHHHQHHDQSSTGATGDANNNLGAMNWGFAGIGGMGMGLGVVLDDEILKLRDEDVMVPSAGKKKSAKLMGKVKLEWKERWVVVQGDTLYICKDREDVNPTQRMSLSSLVSIRDKDFLLSYPSPATSPFVPTSTPTTSGPDFDGMIFDSPSPGNRGKDKLNNHTKYVICARFRSNDSGSQHRGRSSTRAEESGSMKGKKKDKEKNKEKEKTKEKVKDGKDSKSQPRKQKQKSQGSSLGDLSYYSPVGIAAVAGISIPLPYTTTPERKVAVSTSSARKKEEEKHQGEGDHNHDTAKGTTAATTTPGITRPGTAVSQSTEDSFDDGIQDDEETLAHHNNNNLNKPSKSFLGIEITNTTVTTTGLTATSTTSLSQSDNMSSPLFAHTPESEWEMDIGEQQQRRKQPYYHYGYQHAFRWKESSDYDRAKDVWEEGPGAEGEAEDGKKGKSLKEKAKRKERERDLQRSSHDYQYEWIILDVGGSSAFNSMLRVLHRGSPSAVSTFKANYLDKISSENDPPEVVVVGSSSFSSPTRRGRPPPPQRMAFTSDHDDDAYLNIRDYNNNNNNEQDQDVFLPRNDRRAAPPSLLPILTTASRSLSAWNERLGVMPYPEWRLKMTKRAQRAALGNISNAMLFYLFRSLEFAPASPDLVVDTKKPSSSSMMMEKPISRKSQKSQELKRLRAASTATAASSSAHPKSSSKPPAATKSPSSPSDEDALGHLELDIESSSDESKSEKEWHGWILDIPRQHQVQQQQHQHPHQQRQESNQGFDALGGHSSSGAGAGKGAGEETPIPQSPRLICPELDESYGGFEAMRRKALEPTGTVSTTTITTAGAQSERRKRPSTAPRSPVDDRDRGQSQSILSNLPLLPSSNRSVISLPFSSPEPMSPTPARRRLPSMKSSSPRSQQQHMPTTGSIFRTSDLPLPSIHLISRRRPSMPQLSFGPKMFSDFGESRYHGLPPAPPPSAAINAGRRGSSPPDAFDEFSSPGKSGGSGPSQFIRRRASAAGLITSGLAGSLGRSFIGGFWRKDKDGKDRDRGSPRESGASSTVQSLLLSDEQREHNNNSKKGKGKGKAKATTLEGGGDLYFNSNNNIPPRPESSLEGGARSLSPPATPAAIGRYIIPPSQLESATSGSSAAAATTTSTEDDDKDGDEEEQLGLGPPQAAGPKSEKWKLNKGRFAFEMDKVTRGFDGE